MNDRLMSYASERDQTALDGLVECFQRQNALSVGVGCQRTYRGINRHLPNSLPSHLHNKSSFCTGSTLKHQI